MGANQPRSLPARIEPRPVRALSRPCQLPASGRRRLELSRPQAKVAFCVQAVISPILANLYPSLITLKLTTEPCAMLRFSTRVGGGSSTQSSV